MSRRLLLLAGLSIACAGCGVHGDAVQGAVFEVRNPQAPSAKWQLSPLADVEVLVLWRGAPTTNPAHNSSICLRATYTRTDAKGQFSLPGWRDSSQSGWLMEMRPPTSIPFTPGYEFVPREPGLEHAWSAAPGVHILRRSTQPEGAPSRETLFQEANACPVVERAKSGTSTP